MPAWTYILKCADGSYYTGCTTNLEQRLFDHNDGTHDGYTKKRRPLKLVFKEEFDDIRLAIELERKIKGWSKSKKEALINGDFDLLKELAKPAYKKRR